MSKVLAGELNSLAKQISGLGVAEDSTEQLIISLDFGTTYSGIAYVFAAQGKPDPQAVYEWPGSEGQKAPKTPTLIDYNSEDKRSFTWGAKVDPTSQDKLEGIKLLLDPDQQRPLFVPAENTKKLLKRLGKPPMDVASDYIGALYKHALEKIYGAYPQEYVDMQEKKFVLTVPAVWSDKAKDLTLRAAKNAGIDPIVLIKEPEAAALYTLHHLKGKALSVGDAFVICDAGGGTVDLISYEVTNVTPLELKELVPSTGGLAGSLMLNKRFEESVQHMVGDEEFLALKKTTGFAAAVKSFDKEVKPAFSGDPQQSWFVSFPMAHLEDDPDNNIQAGTLHLKSEAVHQIFEPVIGEIERLVTEQVDKVRIKRMAANHPKGADIKAIFLVGGFGSSQYLKERLKKKNHNIQVIQPPDAWSAIVKGAVLSQLTLEAAIRSTQAVRHYGVSATYIYKESEDGEEPKIWDRFEQLFRVSKMKWFINLGDDLVRDKRVENTFYRKLPADFTSADLVFVDELLESKADQADKYPRDGITKFNCKVVANLSSVPRSEFEHRVSPDGKPYVTIGYKLIITTKTANMKFSMEIKGKEMGTVDATYD